MKIGKTKPLSKHGSVIDCWTAAARGTVQQAKRGTPRGDCAVLAKMEAEWTKTPNALMEDEAGHLWLAFMHKGAIDDDEGYEPVTVEEALTWLQHVSELADGYDVDVADVCRIALGELARRPNDMDRVKAAVMSEIKAGTSFGRGRNAK